MKSCVLNLHAAVRHVCRLSLIYHAVSFIQFTMQIFFPQKCCTLRKWLNICLEIHYWNRGRFVRYLRRYGLHSFSLISDAHIGVARANYNLAVVQ